MKGSGVVKMGSMDGRIFFKPFELKCPTVGHGKLGFCGVNGWLLENAMANPPICASSWGGWSEWWSGSFKVN